MQINYEGRASSMHSVLLFSNHNNAQNWERHNQLTIWGSASLPLFALWELGDVPFKEFCEDRMLQISINPFLKLA
jgi:hypothetical protein